MNLHSSCKSPEKRVFGGDETKQGAGEESLGRLKWEKIVKIAALVIWIVGVLVGVVVYFFAK